MLTTIDEIITLAALALLALAVIQGIRHRGPTALLARAPGRPNRLRVESLLLVFFVTFAAAGLIDGVIRWTDADPADIRMRLIVNTVVPLIGIVACLMIARRDFDGGATAFCFGGSRLPDDDVRRQSIGGQACLAVAVTVMGIGLCSLILEATVSVVLWLKPDYTFDPHPTIAALHDGSQPFFVIAVLWLNAILLAPVAEEFFFRGLLQTFIGNVMHNRWLAIVLTSGAFGIVHFQQVQAVPALIALSILIGFLYERSGSLLPAVGVHVAFNLKTLVWEAVTTQIPT
ncbi:MAG: CPBP family intramembrane metalloprotease [Chloroflexi bacterium]|nr:CPBP family intramembrane metalloprotease [Chloroflexota bacterium]